MLDMLVVGGGINGVGIARDAAGRGLAVALCEQHDLAQHTSSASSKLVHGGLRYLQQGRIGLVRHALTERSILLRIAPHLVTPLPFLIPHAPGLRPAWMLQIGLHLYDCLASGGDHPLSLSQRIDLRRHPLGEGLADRAQPGFTYMDAQVHDARLVISNAIDAHEHGARIWTRTRCVFADRQPRHWDVTLENQAGCLHRLQARALVNATGPWAASFATDLADSACPALRLVQGSHIVVPALFAHGHALLLQQKDRRVVFAIPYEDHYTLIGTTDIEYAGNPADVRIDTSQRAYLCDAVNHYVQCPVLTDDIVHQYSGVRPLIASRQREPRDSTRDYRLLLDRADAPLLNIFGGKLTTYRRLAEQAVDLLLGEQQRARPAWTRNGTVLPGGELGPPTAVAAWLRQRWPWLPDPLVQRWSRSQGSRAAMIIGNAGSLQDLGQDFGAHLHAAEVTHLREHEWAQDADDVLWRRTQLGLVLSAAQQQTLSDWMQCHPATSSAFPGADNA